MKTNCTFWVTILLISTNFLLAQNVGVFLTFTDFNNKKISYSKKGHTNYKLNADRIFHSNTIKIVIGDSSYIFYKDSVFGYRDEQNNYYRFYNNKSYLMLNPDDSILLYSITSLINCKGYKTITNYFFSTRFNSTIIPLTKSNLKKAFSHNSNFYALIDVCFDNDKELTKYDSFYNTYTINKIYQLN